MKVAGFGEIMLRLSTDVGKCAYCSITLWDRYKNDNFCFK